MKNGKNFRTSDWRTRSATLRCRQAAARRAALRALITGRRPVTAR